MRRVSSRIAVGLIGAWLMGCASSEVVPASGPRPALDASAVKVYQTAPKKYEKHGLVEVPVTGSTSWAERGDATAGFDRLKAQAASRGSNGLLLTLDPKDFKLMVTAADRGTFYQVPLQETPRRAVAEAIYVIEEK